MIWGVCLLCIIVILFYMLDFKEKEEIKLIQNEEIYIDIDTSTANVDSII